MRVLIVKKEFLNLGTGQPSDDGLFPAMRSK